MSKILTAYFSASGTTAKAAKQLAEAVGADLYEIKAAVPYTKKDLNWLNPKSRTTLEMHDLSGRPAIENDPVDISSYDTVLVGFPIWWYVAPTIINTFLESHDFSGKRIILFATSGGSAFGETVKNLRPSVAPDTEIIEGGILNGRKTAEAIESIKAKI